MDMDEVYSASSSFLELREELNARIRRREEEEAAAAKMKFETPKP